MAIIAALLAGAAGCRPEGPGGVRELADGRLVPDRWSGVIPPIAQDRATRRLHYDSLYVAPPKNWNVSPRPGRRARWEMRWYRFWDGGQVLEKVWFAEAPDDAPPTAAQGDEFRGPGVGVGRYAVIGDRLLMEFVGLLESGWVWYRETGQVNEDGSFTLFPRRQPGFAGPPEPSVTYRRHVVGEMKRFPDW